MSLQLSSPGEVLYPESDGQPISDHTLQFEWIVTVKENLEALFADDENVFVAGDLLWYPVEGDNKTRIAPNALVAFGRPKGDRGSYQQWNEGGIAPQVVFEVLSPGNRAGEMISKFIFYQKHGVEEYYLYDPFKKDFSAWVRRDPGGYELTRVEQAEDWTSPRLGIRFVSHEDASLEVYYPNGERFWTFLELKQRADRLKQQADNAEQRADDAEDRATAAEERVALLAARLRELGLNPDEV